MCELSFCVIQFYNCNQDIHIYFNSAKNFVHLIGVKFVLDDNYINLFNNKMLIAKCYK